MVRTSGFLDRVLCVPFVLTYRSLLPIGAMSTATTSGYLRGTVRVFPAAPFPRARLNTN